MSKHDKDKDKHDKDKHDKDKEKHDKDKHDKDKDKHGKDQDKHDKHEKDKHGKDQDKHDKDKDKHDKDKEKHEKDKHDKHEKDKHEKDKHDKGKDKDKKKDKKAKTKEEKKSKKEKLEKLSKDEKKQRKEEKKSNKLQKKDELLSTVDVYHPEVFADYKEKVAQATNDCKAGNRGEVAEKSLVELAHAGSAPGLEVWRIEQFSIVPVPKNTYGQFYDGDSYVVLHTEKLQSGALQWNIFFWIGENSTQDEYGAAAVWIDDKLGGKATQHREVQDFESQQFLALFTPGLQILKGGIDSAFRHVDRDEHRVRLLHIKGKKNIRMTEVPAYPISLNSGDVFVLDTKDSIYEWIGKESSVFERRKAGELATALRDQRGSKPTIVTIEEAQGDDNAEFWEFLGGKGQIQTAAEGGDDIRADAEKGTEKKLFQMSDSTGQWSLKPVASGNITKDMFKTEDVFIFDTGFEIFVWVGKGSSVGERGAGLGQAQQYLKDNGRPVYLPVIKIQEATEHHTFLAALG